MFNHGTGTWLIAFLKRCSALEEAFCFANVLPACIHRQICFTSYFLWANDPKAFILCCYVHIGMLLRSSSFEAGGVTAAGIQDTVNHIQFKNSIFGLIRMEEALPYSTCQGVSSIHVVLGELGFCMQKAVWFHVRAELCLLNTSSWDFTFQKWSAEVRNSSWHDIVVRFSKQLGSSLLRAMTGSIFNWNTWQQGGRWNSLFQGHAWNALVTPSLKSPVSF